MTMTESRRLLTAKEVYRLLRISESKFYRMLRAGDFPQGHRLGPGAVRWREGDVVGWIDSLT